MKNYTVCSAKLIPHFFASNETDQIEIDVIKSKVVI